MAQKKKASVSMTKSRLLTIDLVLETESHLHASRIKEGVDAAVDNLVESLLADGVDIKSMRWGAHYDYRRFTLRDQYAEYLDEEANEEQD